MFWVRILPLASLNINQPSHWIIHKVTQSKVDRCWPFFTLMLSTKENKSDINSDNLARERARQKFIPKSMKISSFLMNNFPWNVDIFRARVECISLCRSAIKFSPIVSKDRFIFLPRSICLINSFATDCQRNQKWNYRKMNIYNQQNEIYRHFTYCSVRGESIFIQFVISSPSPPPVQSWQLK